jgi:hypothetical protein
MATYIGFDRRITLDWLDETAGLVLQGRDTAFVRAALHERLKEEINGSEARTKTITLLCRIWANPPIASHLRDEALLLLPELLPGQRIWLHWGLILLAFPLFRDITANVGRLLQLQGACSVGQVTDRMVTTWGERSTLVRATQRILRSLVEWQIIAETDSPGLFHATKPRTTDATLLHHWFLEAALRAHTHDGVPIAELAHLPEIFPFSITSSTRELYRLERFEILAQGSGVDLVYPAHRLQLIAQNA